MATDPVQIGRYRILRTLGQGAMGTVYLAEDPALKRSLAIKVVRGPSGDAEVLERFRREAEISARLNHPNIITIFDVGEEPGQGPFLAMEFVDGEGLDALVKSGPIPPGEAMPLLLQAGQALEAIHQAGIIHRDVKPLNFRVAKDGRIKLMDFGIARGDGPRLTTTAAFLGTPAYAAPESLSGSGRPDASVDRWALAVTAFEMLTGQLPFAAESVNAALYRVAHEPPRFPEGMSDELQAVFNKALDKDPSHRHGSVRDFLRALADALPLDPAARSAVTAQLETPAFATGLYRSPSKRRVPRAAWIAALGLLLVGATGWYFWRALNQTRVIAIYSTPPGAEVTLDGIRLGQTPLPQVVIRGRAGTLHLEKPEYLPLDHTLTSDEERLDLHLSLVPTRIAIASDPMGAEIRLDGQPLGKSPQEIQVPGEGRHELELKLEGYETWTGIIARRQPPPALIRLRRPRPNAAPVEKPGKVKRFFKDLLKP
ncbi:MAG: serine/threonine protein kinase [Acidobacteria bacterium]|nr:serine/threonine protein kinase [Acidobacteriota bacterium]